MKTSSFKSALIQLLLLGLLLSAAPVRADGPTIFDIVRQTANIPAPGHVGAFVPPDATVFATGPRAAYWVRGLGAQSGWSYTAANGWQFAVSTQNLQQSPQAVAEIPIRVPAYRPPPEFRPNWAAQVGLAFMRRIGQIAPLWGTYMYMPALDKPVNWNAPVVN